MNDLDPLWANSHYQLPGSKESLAKIIAFIKESKHFLFLTHKDPDADGIGSMLAFGEALLNAKKDVTLLMEEPVPAPFDRLKGANSIVQYFDSKKTFDVILALDCAGVKRVGSPKDYIERLRPLINIDHHETNDFFGDLNLVDTNSSSTGELVFKLIQASALPMNHDIAENLFVAIQFDTGSFKYDNTTSTSLRIAADLMDYGIRPWQISLNISDVYSLSRLKLLEMALDTVEFHYKGKICIMTVTLDMFKKAKAHRSDGEKFVDYPRFVSGVEIAVLIRQTAKDHYKFSLRSNTGINVSDLALLFGGGGHARAAGFECSGSINLLKEKLLRKAVPFLDGECN